MMEVLDSFNSIVLNVVKQLLTSRGLRRFVSEYDKTEGHRDHVSVKAVMLASMRSLVPKDWDGDFEVAWNRLWDNIQRMLQVRIGRTPVTCAALKSFATTLDKEPKPALEHRLCYIFMVGPAG